MAVKLYHIFLLTTLFGQAATTHAGLERFWSISKDDVAVEEQLNECDHLNKEQQHQLITTYQSIRDEEQKLDLKKRMEWFCQLSDDEQQRMRLAWQNMSTQERNQLKKKLQTTTDSEKRNQIRHEVVKKYNNIN
ncbi:MAG: restriction endonuclease [Acinetobacter sp.]|jgi:hypothetical protein|nr:MAG: restriction endonuclease [Acinetobacter sp.]